MNLANQKMKLDISEPGWKQMLALALNNGMDVGQLLSGFGKAHSAAQDADDAFAYFGEAIGKAFAAQPPEVDEKPKTAPIKIMNTKEIQLKQEQQKALVEEYGSLVAAEEQKAIGKISKELAADLEHSIFADVAKTVFLAEAEDIKAKNIKNAKKAAFTSLYGASEETVKKLTENAESAAVGYAKAQYDKAKKHKFKYNKDFKADPFAEYNANDAELADQQKYTPPKTKQEQLIAELEQVLPMMPPAKLDQATQLVVEFKSGGKLWPKQWEDIPKLIISAIEYDPNNPTSPDGPLMLGDFTKVFKKLAYLEGKKTGYKHPKVKLLLEDGSPIVFYLATPASKHFGKLQLTDGGPYPHGAWYGTIAKDGTWDWSEDADLSGKIDMIETALSCLVSSSDVEFEITMTNGLIY